MRVWSPDAEPRAVLREVDQVHGRSPVACVKTGQRTEGAVRVRAVGLGRAAAIEMLAGATLLRLAARLLRRPSITVVLAMSPSAWSRWRRRSVPAVVIMAAGLGVVVAGSIRGDPGSVVFGGAVGALGWWLRIRAWLACWVAAWFRADGGEIVVARVHPVFADEARQIYVNSIRRHPAPR